MRDKERIIFAIVMGIILLLIAVVGVLELHQLISVSRAEWEPTTVYPMANANVSWQQTHYAGSWE